MTKLSYHERRALGTRVTESGETEGLDPREMPKILLGKIGHTHRPLLRIIRDKCLDCSHSVSEVRRCTAVDCSLWPYRLGSNPLRPERSEAQKEADRRAGERMREYQRKNGNGASPDDEDE